ncbi:lytic murein transglycosylase [Salinibacterium sp. SYSU T00001]|uniref:lytic transglycosylase domain-containing protein n=1 Tax=Homoserinimonas sedimenticola TaxID=2986805 RepID=UPI0022362E3C|nr:lytic murein transglycosylase [Salinibacterium sedimenticola]MCW4385979.1 lytic murein transglycosylase [Salinibacterium sedimenticola]
MAHGSGGGPRPARRGVDWALVGGIVAGVSALGILLALVVLRPGTSGIPDEVVTPGVSSSPPYAAAAPLPPRSATPGAGPVMVADAAWVRSVAEETGIPERALAAYAGAALFKATDRPDCGLGWNTLAAIGLVESDHGRHAGSRIGADGTAHPPILGIALDGSQSARIPDTDDGEFDGDAEYDRAVGPMQLIPQTWINWHVDGNGDGVEDPQNIDDAALAAANYLCRASPDMTDEEGWRAGVGAYNDSRVYLRSVADAANRYAELLASAGTG